MATTDSAFTGAIPQVYATHLVPFLFEPYARDMAERVAALGPRSVLETAAGTGAVTRALAARLPSDTRIAATDINQAMLDVAAAAAPPDDRLAYSASDATELPFEDETFDVAVSQFGVMFFPDRPAAYRQARRVLRRDGRFLFNVWDRLQDNPIPLALTQILAAEFPDDPPGFIRRVPYGYNDASAIRDDLEAAGFTDIAIETVALPCAAPSAADVATGFCQGTPIRAEIEARAPDRLSATTQAVAKGLAERFGDGPIESRLQALVVSARR